VVKQFYRNLRLLLLMICLILFWGFSSYQILPRQEDPELVSRIAVVSTRFPGASAQRVEALVTEIIEEEISEIEEIKTIESDSLAGISTIQIELQDAVKKAETIWSQVRDELADAIPQLPEGALEPELQEVDIRAYAMIAALTWEGESNSLTNSAPASDALTPSSSANYAILHRFAEELEDQLRAVNGTEQVDLFGDPEEEIVVETSSAELAAIGLNVQQLSQQIRLSDAKVSAGQLRSQGKNLSIEVESELDSLERVRQMPIQSSNQGQFTRLGDIAQVTKGIIEPPSDAALVQGKPAIAVGVLMKSGGRIDQWAGAVREQVAAFREQLPPGIGLELIFDQSQYVEARLNGLIANLLIGGLLVIGVTVFAMGWQSSLIIGSALPLTTLMVLGLMRVFALPLQQMSVTGLIIALGLLIDNAIVMVDEVQARLHQGVKPETAVIQSTKYLRVPLLASTLTTILAFMPIALLPGPAGEFVGSIAITVILALLSSLLLSLTVIPALAGRLYRRSTESSESTIEQTSQRQSHSIFPLLKSWWQKGFSSPRLTRIYRRSLDGVIKRPIWGVLIALTLPLLGFFQAGTLQEQFFPSVDRDQFQIEFELPAQTSIDKTYSEVATARELLLQHPEVVGVHWFVGESAPKFFYNITGNRENAANYGQALVQLNSPQKSRQLIRKLQRELDEAFPEAQILVRQLEQGPPFEAPIEMRLYGPDLERLRELGNQVRATLAQVPDVVHTRADLSEALPKLGLRLNEEEARLAGLDHTAIAQQLDANLEGAVGGSILEATEELPVRVRLSNAKRGNLEQIASVNLLPGTAAVSDGSQFRPLSALGNFALVPELAKISRRNQQRVNTVQGFITAGVLPAKVLTDFQQQLESSGFDLPPGYSFEFGGESAERNEAVGNLMATVGLLVVLMIATLVLSLASFRLAGIILVVAVCSVGLALAALWLFDSPLGFMAIVGTMGLVGIAINDSIVVLVALQEDPLARQGNRQAVREVVVHATRHVLTTTITTMAGFVPLLLEGGEFWRPLAIAIAGGIGGSTLLALYLAPSAYLLLMGKKKKAQMQLKYISSH